MSIDLSQFIPNFLEESKEGLEVMESGLLALEVGDAESMNAIFRAAHSIKGGAGTFGFEHVTEFTHLVETLLDEIRSGNRPIEQHSVEVLLSSVDCIRLLLEDKSADISSDPAIQDTADKLEAILSCPADQLSQEGGAEPLIVDNISDFAETKESVWNIKFHPEAYLVQTGNDPLLLFNALADLGSLSLIANLDELPNFVKLEPTELYLSWDLRLVTTANRDEITEVFEWIEDDCELYIEQASQRVIENEVNNQNTANQLSEPISSTAIEQSQSPEQVTATPIATEASTSPSIKPVVNKTASTEMTSKPKAENSSIRVGVDKIDVLINLVGEQVIIQSMLTELGNDFDMTKIDRLKAGLEQLLQNTKELQESVMRIRMLPISFAFNRLPRLVHDLAKKTGKEIDLVISGENTELDKTVMEQIGDPLVHLIRNAADHGIEAAEVRKTKGKSQNGKISLDAYHQGGNIVIEISDDGAGINKDVILNKAVEKNIVESTAVLTEAQTYDLLFEPGFSTAKEVSDISGRGVGMDVVKKNIQSLGGRIQVDSKVDEGSTFKVYLPLTLAILDGQLVKVGNETYIIPLLAIVESLQAKPELINRVSGDMCLYRLRDDNVPILPMSEIFNIYDETKEPENALLVVVEANEQKIGLMVDDLMAQQQVVIKSLKDNYQQVDGISGATILGDGSVAMILDIPGIIAMAMKKTAATFHSKPEALNLKESGVIH